MTRHEIPCKEPGHSCTIGWDGPLASYFAIVTTDAGDLEDDNVVLWIGGKPRDCVRLDDLVARLKPYADVPLELRAQLERDRAEAPPPSPLQREMMRIMESGGRGR